MSAVRGGCHLRAQAARLRVTFDLICLLDTSVSQQGGVLTPFPRLMSVSALEGLWRHASSPRLFGGAVASGRGAWDLAREGGNPLVDCFRVCTFELPSDF